VLLVVSLESVLVPFATAFPPSSCSFCIR